MPVEMDLVEPFTVWVCGACGKTAPNRYDFADVSCAMNSVECASEKSAEGHWTAIMGPEMPIEMHMARMTRR